MRTAPSANYHFSENGRMIHNERFSARPEGIVEGLAPLNWSNRTSRSTKQLRRAEIQNRGAVNPQVLEDVAASVASVQRRRNDMGGKIGDIEVASCKNH